MTYLYDFVHPRKPGVERYTVAQPLRATVNLLRLAAGGFERDPQGHFDIFIPLRSVRIEGRSLKSRRSTFTYRAGSVGFTDPAGYWEISWSGALEGVSIHIEPDEMERALKRVGADTGLVWRSAHGDHAPLIAYLGLELAAEVIRGPQSDGYLACLSDAFFAALSRRYSAPAAAQPGRIGLLSPQVSRAVSHIEQHLEGDLSALRVAEAAGASPAHLARLFREQLGASLGRYVRERRLNEAARLLETTDMSVETVAFVTGHGGRSAFTRTFTQAKGCSPGLWRARARDGGRDGV
ncbi:MAG: AraC family transcriptional regulator [Oceanicaulis sp.]